MRDCFTNNWIKAVVAIVLAAVLIYTVAIDLFAPCKEETFCKNAGAMISCDLGFPCSSEQVYGWYVRCTGLDESGKLIDKKVVCP